MVGGVRCQTNAFPATATCHIESDAREASKTDTASRLNDLIVGKTERYRLIIRIWQRLTPVRGVSAQISLQGSHSSRDFPTVHCSADR